MKPKILISPFQGALALVVFSSPHLCASSGDLTAVSTSPNWNTATNWTTNPNPSPGTAAGDVVGVASNITATSTLNINSVSRIVGTLNIGDSDNSNSFIINTTTGLSLTFNNSGSGATINETGSVTDTLATAVPVILADNLTTNTGGRLHINGLISETGGAKNLTKSGNGILQLANSNNSYTGVTAITGTQGGILVTANNALGSATGNTTVAAGTTLGLSGGINYSTAETVVGSGSGSSVISGAFAVASRGFIQSVSGNNTFAGAIQIDATGISRIGTQDGASLTLTGAITKTTGTSGVNVLFRAGNTNGDFITLTNTANSWDGQTQIFSGNTSTGSGLRLGASNVLPISSPVAVVLNSTSGTRLDLASYNQEVNGLILNTPTTNLKITNSVAATTSTLTLNTTLDRLFDAGGVIEDGAGIVRLVKTGSATQVLGGANTYTGTTQVSAGALVINGSLANTTTTVSGTGTLQGIGTIGGSVTVGSGGTLAPGTTIESLGVGNLAFQNGSTFAYELDSNSLNGDLVYSAGTLDIASSSTLTLTQLASGTLSAGTKLTLIGYMGGWTSSELFTYLGSTLADDSTFTLGANTWLFNYNDTSGGSNYSADQSSSTSFVTMTVVPEPCAALLGGLGFLTLLRRRRA